MITEPLKSRLEKPSDDEENRRVFMKKMVALFGATTAASVLNGCSLPVAKQFVQQRPVANTKRALFTEHQASILYSLCETILPKTDTPSAVEVGCHEFIVHQLLHCHSPQQQDETQNIINSVDKLANTRFTQPFV